jgi:hypothetical protein
MHVYSILDLEITNLGMRPFLFSDVMQCWMQLVTDISGQPIIGPSFKSQAVQQQRLTAWYLEDWTECCP